jgi:O-antigen ligase
MGVQGLPEQIIGIPGVSILLLIPFWLVIIDTVRKFGSSAIWPSKRYVSQRILFRLTVLLLVFIFVACLRAFFDIGLFAKARTINISLLWITIPLYFLALRIRGFSLGLVNNIFMSSMGLYLFVNLSLYLLGVASPFSIHLENGHALLSGMLGLNTVRTALPLSYDTGSGGAVAGLAMLGAIAGMLFSNARKQKILFFGLLLLSLWAIFLTDSRGALFFGVGAILVVLLAPLFVMPRVARLTLFLAPLLVMLLVVLPNYLPEFLTGESAITRGESTIVSGRDLIWNVVLDKLAAFEPIHLIGYGLNGHLSSGVSEGYAEMFTDSADLSEAMLIPVHNNIFQLVLDLGYMGMLVYLLIFYILFKVHINRGISAGGKFFGNVMILSGLLYLMLIGLTSVTLYYANSVLIFSWFIMVLVFSVVDIPGELSAHGGINRANKC